MICFVLSDSSNSELTRWYSSEYVSGSTSLSCRLVMFLEKVQIPPLLQIVIWLRCISNKFKTFGGTGKGRPGGQKFILALIAS